MEKMINRIDRGMMLRETVGEHRLLLVGDRMTLTKNGFIQCWRSNSTYKDFDDAVARLEEFYKLNSDVQFDPFLADASWEGWGSVSRIKMRCMQGVWYVETVYYKVHCVAIADSVREALRALRSDMRYTEVFALSQPYTKIVQKALTASSAEVL